MCANKNYDDEKEVHDDEPAFGAIGTPLFAKRPQGRHLTAKGSIKEDVKDDREVDDEERVKKQVNLRECVRVSKFNQVQQAEADSVRVSSKDSADDFRLGHQGCILQRGCDHYELRYGQGKDDYKRSVQGHSRKDAPEANELRAVMLTGRVLQVGKNEAGSENRLLNQSSHEVRERQTDEENRCWATKYLEGVRPEHQQKKAVG